MVPPCTVHPLPRSHLYALTDLTLPVHSPVHLTRRTHAFRYFVQRGQARIIIGRGDKKREKQVGAVSAGGFFGEMALTSAGGCRRAATVISSTLLICLKLHRDVLDDVAADFPRLMMNLRQIANSRRRCLGEDIGEVSKMSIQASIGRSFAAKLLGRVASQTSSVSPEPSGASTANFVMAPLQQLREEEERKTNFISTMKQAGKCNYKRAPSMGNIKMPAMSLWGAGHRRYALRSGTPSSQEPPTTSSSSPAV